MANLFSPSINLLPIKILICLVLTGAAAVAGVTYYFTPKYTRVGYMPNQPIAFSHALHVNQLGMDCRYCHSHVEISGHSNVPTTQTCMNCHSQVKKDSSKLAVLRESWEKDTPIPWTKIHQAPDYVYFNHAVHVARGVSCVSCHGNINRMEVVWHDQPMSMGWCLECHRNPEYHLRPVSEVTNLDWTPPEGTTQQAIGLKIKQSANIQPPQNCSGCHR
jgi:hypothetical protein